MDALAKMRTAIGAARAAGQLPSVDEASLEQAYFPLAARLGRSCSTGGASSRTVAIAGPPGSGKSTLSEFLGVMLDAGYGLRCARFGLDDVYLSKAERLEMGRRVHPLFATRGAPGTHRTETIVSLLGALRTANEATLTALPRFDKSLDDTSPCSEWPLFVGKPHVILFDTWLWNVRPPNDEELSEPINRREAERDPDGTWRIASAQAFRDRYVGVFSEADEWIKIEPPGWEAMVRFREEQERNRILRMSEGAREALPKPEHPIGYFLELFERWLRLPHTREPDHRIVLDEQHSARLL